ncbi:cAMP/cGMP-dependent phosphodiesterase [Acrasis kona]|uniref:cAMP/cGMP-dependent phosphodiesterase n=1 Tax=Acrasis kona TaxID=1008807 RepID=A0AAW2Z368_9EUKA
MDMDEVITDRRVRTTSVGTSPRLDSYTEDVDVRYPMKSKFDRFKEYLSHKSSLRMRLLVLISVLIVILFLMIIAGIILVPRIISYTVSRNQVCSFSAVILGNGGGSSEDNLSSVLISLGNSDRFIAFDAGTLLHGIRKFISSEGLLYNNYVGSNRNMIFPIPTKYTREIQRAGYLLRNHVLAYFIGHPHFDHVAGLILNSPEDHFVNEGTAEGDFPKRKSIIGTNITLSVLQDEVFDNKLWPNLSYQYNYIQKMNNGTYDVNELLAFTNLSPNSPYMTAFKNSKMTVFETCHSGSSTAFLLTKLENNQTQDQALYFSDTGLSTQDPSCDWRSKLNNIWSHPMFQLKKLRVMFIEVSFEDSIPDNKLYGHLKPSLLITTLKDMMVATRETDLSHVKIIIQHTKQLFDAAEDPRDVIAKQLQSSGINAQFLFPIQGDYLCL